MGFKELLEKIGERKRERKERFKQADEDYRIQKMIEDRQKSANERELERFQKEEREVQIKELLEYHREKKDNDLKFNHNPLHTPNITKSDYHILKEKNQFANNKNLFKNNKQLFIK
jgi:hypothetical protein